MFELNLFSFAIVVILLVIFWSLIAKTKKVVVESADIALDSLSVANISIAKEARILQSTHDISLIKRTQELHQEATELKGDTSLVSLSTLEKELSSLL